MCSPSCRSPRKRSRSGPIQGAAAAITAAGPLVVPPLPLAEKTTCGARLAGPPPFERRVGQAAANESSQQTSVRTDFREDLRAKRDLLAAGLTDAGFQVYAPQGTYFITTDIADLAPGTDALTFCRTLPEKCGVVAVPNSVFYDHPTAGRTQVRFAFCKRETVLTEAASRLRKAFNS
ncbi:aminotransferase class I/II-fold pyridoxal phosphate-dependent enzyme [Streptomyces sp. NBC_01198]|nr:aminotransferase class I/II-fold pyridoxal phosphate-dependent enzyme [Streptomyces sp. NBC_01198]